MRGSTEHRIKPLRRAISPARVDVLHDEFVATEYEIFIPAGIWTHTAVQEFLDEPLRAEGGATISKGATGLWRGGQEETHVIRIVVRHTAERDSWSRPLLRPPATPGRASDGTTGRMAGGASARGHVHGERGARRGVATRAAPPPAGNRP
jgi:hypothetical protein